MVDACLPRDRSLELNGGTPAVFVIPGNTFYAPDTVTLVLGNNQVLELEIDTSDSRDWTVDYEEEIENAIEIC